jgi:hypothetical protein
MAKSNAHAWGQKIGEVLEDAILSLLMDFAQRHHLYLDKRGERPARPGKKATWKDVNGNQHDLDYVLERGGTADRIGSPVAFIEIAWRRYTKHSKNKAQEIQGAIMPLVEAHKNAPFLGAILAGEFTANALTQLRTLGFSVLYFPYKGIVDAMAQIGIDAAFEENTSEKALRQKLNAWSNLDVTEKAKAGEAILKLHKKQVAEFFAKLELSVSRKIETVFVVPLYGVGNELRSVSSAIKFIEEYEEVSTKLPIHTYLVQIRYNTGEQIEAKLSSKEAALGFLRSYLPPPISPVKVT